LPPGEFQHPVSLCALGYLDSAITLVGESAGGAHYLNETTSTVSTINFADGNDGDFTSGNSAFPGGTGDNFAMRVTATLIVNTPGEYTFVVNSDDGARLRIDGVDVIVDDGTHAPSASSGRITLNKATAQLELIYFDTTGNAELELGWIRPISRGNSSASSPRPRRSCRDRCSFPNSWPIIRRCSMRMASLPTGSRFGTRRLRP
jgi:hypothetical protein